jgi:hypothetical protein
MNRITQRNNMGQAIFKRAVSCSRCGEDDYDVYPDFDGITVAQKLALYEDSEEQGLMVRLPCEPGSRVYLVGNGKIYEYNFMGIVKFNHWKPTLFGRQLFGNREDVKIANADQWGKTVFSSLAEAEQKCS